MHPQEGCQHLAAWWKDATSFLLEAFAHQRPRGPPSRAGKDRDCWDEGAWDEKKQCYTPFQEKTGDVPGMNVSSLRDLAVALNTLAPEQCLRIPAGVGCTVPRRPRTGVVGLDLDAVRPGLRRYLVTVYRGLPPSSGGVGWEG